MKHLTYIFIALLLSITYACSSNDLYDDMPRAIQSFISQYYPNSQLENVTSTDSGYVVEVKNGATIKFGLNYKWTEVNGNGNVLPSVLLFNDFPPDLYDYLQETENTNSVYKVIRNSTTYTVELLNMTLYYDIASGEITSNEAG